MVGTAIFNGFIEQVGLYLGAVMMIAGIVVLAIGALYLMVRSTHSCNCACTRRSPRARNDPLTRHSRECSSKTSTYDGS
jgi:hypothetical protein